MRTFFHGWRRKTGCITLLIACVLMGAWIKSRFVADTISVTIGSFTTYKICFFNRGIVLLSLVENGSPGDGSRYPRFEWSSERYPDRHHPGEIPSPIDALADRAVCGFSYYGQSSDHESFRIWIIPFLAVVGPVTLLSAYLILRKPHQAIR